MRSAIRSIAARVCARSSFAFRQIFALLPTRPPRVALAFGYALLLATSALVSSPARGQTVTGTPADTNNPRGIAIDPITNKIYLADYSGTLTVIDGATNAASTISYGGTENWAVAVNTVTNYVYVADRGTSAVDVFLGATATAPAKFLKSIATGQNNLYCIAVNPITNMVYTCDNGSFNVTVINGSTNTKVTDISTGSLLPVTIAVNPVTDMIYVVDPDNPDLLVIDGSTNAPAVLPNSNPNPITIGSTPSSIAVNPVTNRIYVANMSSNNVSVVDGSTGSLITNVQDTSASEPVAVAVNPVTDQIYVANMGSSNTSVIDGQLNTVTDISTSAGTSSIGTSIAVDIATNLAYVANSGNGTVTVINGYTLLPTTQLTVQAEAREIAVNPITHKVYAAPGVFSESVGVSVIDAATNTVTTPMYPAGTSPWAVAVDPVSNTIFVANNSNGTVSVIDGGTNTPDPASPITVGTNPNALVVDPINDLIYVSNSGSSSVSVINGQALSSPPSTVLLDNNTSPNLLAFNPVLNQVYGASTSQGVGFSFPGGNLSPVTPGPFFAGSTPIAIGTNPALGYNYALFSDTNSLQISDVHGGGAVPVCSGPTAADINTVTNTIYVACGGSTGTLDAIQGADSFEPTGTSTFINLTNSSSNSKAVVVNPVTNTIYVTDEPGENVSYLYVVSASNNNAVATINLAIDNCYAVTSLAVNIASNKIYLLCTGNDNEPPAQVEVFDGATNTKIATLPIGTANTLQNEIAANPVTGNIYALAYQNPNGGVYVYTENALVDNSLTVTSIGLQPNANNSGNTTVTTSPVFAFTASNNLVPSGPLTGVYFQADTTQGAWTPADPVVGNAGSFTGYASDLTAGFLTPGFHILYAYATDGEDATSANSGIYSVQDGPVVGTITSYGFLVAPPIATINCCTMVFNNTPVGGTSASPNPILINEGGAPMSYSWSISGPDESEFVPDLSQSTCAASGTLQPNSSCEIYVTFQPTGTGPATATLTWTDNSLGVSNSMQSVGFSGTGTAPVTPPSLGESASDPSYSQDPTFAWSDTEPNVTFQCSFTSGMTVSSSYSACTSPANYPGLQENTWYTWSVEAVDSSSNVSSPVTVTWQVIPSQITVTFAGNGTGSVGFNPPSGAVYSCTNTCTEPFNGVPVSLLATPTGGSTFAGWSNVTNDPNDSCTGTGTCLLETVDEPQAVTATFLSPSNYTLTVNELGTGAGDVVDNMSEINCGEANGQPVAGETSCSASYSANTVVTLTATPGTTSSGASTFAGWGGACASVGVINTNGTGTCTLTMSAAMSASANFIPAPTTVTVQFPVSTVPTSVAATFNCPGNPNAGVGNGCSMSDGPNATALQLTVQGSTGFTVNVTATEVPPSTPPSTSYGFDGICESNTDNEAGVGADFDCRFLQFFNYGPTALPSPAGSIVPYCVPYSNGNCVHYEVTGTNGMEPPSNVFTPPVNWLISWNTATPAAPGPYWLGSTPQLYDDPDSPPTPQSAYGTSCTSPMMIGNTSESYYCQFEYDITTVYYPVEPVDSGIGGSTKAFNDVVVAFPPTTLPSATQLPLLNGTSTTTPSNGTATFGSGSISMTINLTNNGATSASGITLNDPLPAGTTWTLSSTSIAGCAISGSSPQVLSCTSPFSLAQTAAATFTVSSSNPPAGVYTNVATFTIGTQQTSAVASINVTPLATALSNLTSYVIPYGQSPQTISGTVAAGGSYPPSGESVNVTIGSTTEPATIGANGVFSVSFPTATINASATPYPITYTYPGDNNFTAVTNNSSSTLTVKKANSATTITSNSPNPSTVNQAVTVGVKVADASADSTGTPTTSVTVTATLGSTQLTCSATLSGGTGSCNVAPNASGAWSLTAEYNGDGNFNTSSTSSATPQTVNPAASALKFNPALLNFGTVDTGGTVVLSMTITNSGTSMVTFSKFAIAAITGDDSTGYLGVAFCPSTLNPGKTCTVIMSFTADSSVTKTHAANLVVTDSASGSPQIIPMEATVIDAVATLSATSINFGTVKSCTTSAAKSVTLKNSGLTALTYSLSVSGNFALASGSGACPNSSSLSPNASCTIYVTFTPELPKGSKSGSIKLTDNALNSPQTISLSGTGD